MNNSDLIVVLGCTATGKTRLAVNLAAQINAEIISADSRQVYRGMDIGTGKDLSEFEVSGKVIPYHLIDIIDAGEEYNVFKFQNDFLIAYKDILERNKKAILCGGTGMYLEAVLKGYRLVQIPKNKIFRRNILNKSDEDLVELLISFKTLHNTTDSTERERIVRAIEIAMFKKKNKALIQDFPKINRKLFGVHFERELLKKRITKRLKERINNEGMIEELENLVKRGVNPEKLKFYGLEYKFITQYVLREITKDQMFKQLNIAIHQFSKRQATWFRKMERNGFEINWIDGNLPLDKKIDFILQKIK